MLIAFRPELENPPREGGFGIITETGMIQLVPGVNQEIPESQWQQARKNPVVKRMMAIGAIEELKEQFTVEDIPHDVQTLASFPLIEGFRIIEIMHDVDQLLAWKKIEGRVRIRNAITKRIETIKIGRA